MTITLRHATPHDGEIIHWLISELADSLDNSDKVQSAPEDFIAGLSSSPPAFEAIIAEQDDTPVGICLFFSSFSSWRGGIGIYVQDLYVARQVRGTGLGRRLMRHVGALARERGATYIRLAVEADNEEGQMFYKKIGMHWAKTDRIFVIDGDNFAVLTN